MTGRWPSLAALAAAAAAGGSPPARAEIKAELRSGEIVVTNVPAAPRSAPAAALPALPGPAAGAPAAPPEIGGLLAGAAARYAFDPTLIQAVVAAESSFDHRAVSKKGARGLMQLMPSTARRFGVRDAHDPAANLEAGVAFLRELTTKFGGDMTLALAAYNAGPEAVARYGGVPPYEETRDYLARIRSFYGEDLQAGDRSGSGSAIRLARVEPGGVPHFTNLRARRLVRPAPAAEGRKPSPR